MESQKQIILKLDDKERILLSDLLELARRYLQYNKDTVKLEFNYNQLDLFLIKLFENL